MKIVRKLLSTIIAGMLILGTNTTFAAQPAMANANAPMTAQMRVDSLANDLKALIGALDGPLFEYACGISNYLKGSTSEDQIQKISRDHQEVLRIINTIKSMIELAERVVATNVVDLSNYQSIAISIRNLDNIDYAVEKKNALKNVNNKLSHEFDQLLDEIQNVIPQSINNLLILQHNYVPVTTRTTSDSQDDDGDNPPVMQTTNDMLPRDITQNASGATSDSEENGDNPPAASRVRVEGAKARLWQRYRDLLEEEKILKQRSQQRQQEIQRQFEAQRQARKQQEQQRQMQEQIQKNTEEALERDRQARKRREEQAQEEAEANAYSPTARPSYRR